MIDHLPFILHEILKYETDDPSPINIVSSVVKLFFRGEEEKKLLS